MAFFQNVFDQEYQGFLSLADRRLAPTFKVAPNRNPQSKQVAWNAGPYDLSSDTDLQLNFSWDPEHKAWCSVSIDVSGSSPAETTGYEVAAKLNADPTFYSMFKATFDSVNLLVTKDSKRQNLKFYFGNDGAEKQLGFNKQAGIAELPEFFDRHTIANIGNFSDSAGMLIRLDEESELDRSIIENAGLNPDEMKADWQLLKGRASGLFTFQKLTVDGSDRITQIIEYPAGAVAGDFARKIQYAYSGANTNPNQVTEIPYVLQNGDLVTP